MITIFTIPKPFTDPHINLIQRNAIKSWKAIHPEIEIILLGNDPGVSETALELQVSHIPQIKTTEWGTPMLDSGFSLVREKARYEIIMYINADIIIAGDLANCLKFAPKGEFLMCGRRTDLDINTEIEFTNKNWRELIEKESKEHGTLHSAAGIDYFIFRKNSYRNMPPLVVGRIGWDIWMILEARCKRFPVIDLSKVFLTIHQNHDYPNLNKGIERKTNPEALKNMSYIDSMVNVFTIEDSTWKMTAHGLRRNYLFWIPHFKRWIKNHSYFLAAR